MSETASYEGVEDRTMPAIVYALYLIGIVNGVTVLLGLVLAYLGRDRCGPRTQTHYTFLIRTFWLWIAWLLIGIALVFWGGIFSLILVGLPFFSLGWAILALIHTWFAVRAIAGVIYLARDEAYPRPYSWLL
jgi:uncharacterized membrane protein